MSKISFRIKYQRWMIEARVSKRESRVKAVPQFDIKILISAQPFVFHITSALIINP